MTDSGDYTYQREGCSTAGDEASALRTRVVVLEAISRELCRRLSAEVCRAAYDDTTRASLDALDSARKALGDEVKR
jgi:hypothetical protein